MADQLKCLRCSRDIEKKVFEENLGYCEPCGEYLDEQHEEEIAELMSTDYEYMSRVYRG